MCEIRRLKIKRQVTKPADVGFENCLFREAEGYKLTQNLPFATDPQYKNGKKKKKEKEQPKITCPYRTNRRHHVLRQADSKGSMPVVVEDTDPH